ncbi:hypothetical protein BU14_1234s0002 [Porphyra umbilicalis]|uniref:Cytoplasmic tRNA 2-thiolation protein 1 C-terminal domain-containing protein n=1 Tax=Porphyra umbilicalis TaxID=2786 RepID=A0A1X6NMG7_PORUM|nr:hypothetical protein BU14_1234s0002 [Porphyra umbilicalis]|eukprot:OSX69730.1 hypothetical protein BU14_1234s0002 [Porphyra umbilicalis]
MPQPSPARTVAAPTQTPGSCVRCGFVTSQTVCKACLFTEGLNRGAAVPVAPAER